MSTRLQLSEFLSHSLAAKPLAIKRGKRTEAQKDYYDRLVRITEALIEWRKASDELDGAFLANGLEPHRPGYFAEIHARLRRARNIEWTPFKYRKVQRLRELAKMNATFEEMYSAYWGEPLKSATKSSAWRANQLKDLIRRLENEQEL